MDKTIVKQVITKNGTSYVNKPTHSDYSLEKMNADNVDFFMVIQPKPEHQDGDIVTAKLYDRRSTLFFPAEFTFNYAAKDEVEAIRIEELTKIGALLKHSPTIITTILRESEEHYLKELGDTKRKPIFKKFPEVQLTISRVLKYHRVHE